MAAGDPIVYSDWDNLYSVLSTVLGPIPVDTGGNPTTPGQGWGLSSSSISSAPYPFTKTISDFARTNLPTVTTSTPHGFANGDIIYISGLTGAWATSAANEQYFTIDTVTSTTFRITNLYLATAGLPAYPGGATVSQPIVHKSQFDRISTDLQNAWTHITGGTGSLSLTNPVKNTVISDSVFSTYYNAINTVNSKKLILGKYQNDLMRTQTQSSTWGEGNAGLTAEWTMTFPSQLALYQYFNTGGMFRFNLQMSNLAPSGTNVAVDANWNTLCTTHFPVYYGAYSKSNMGYNSTTFAPTETVDSNRFTSYGAFDAVTSGYTTIYEKFGTGVYASNYVKLENYKDASNPARLHFKLTLQDTVVNAWVNGVSADVTLTINYLYSIAPVALSFTPPNAVSGIIISFSDNL